MDCWRVSVGGGAREGRGRQGGRERSLVDELVGVALQTRGHAVAAIRLACYVTHSKQETRRRQTGRWWYAPHTHTHIPLIKAGPALQERPILFLFVSCRSTPKPSNPISPHSPCSWCPCIDVALWRHTHGPARTQDLPPQCLEQLQAQRRHAAHYAKPRGHFFVQAAQRLGC